MGQGKFEGARLTAVVDEHPLLFRNRCLAALDQTVIKLASGVAECFIRNIGVAERSYKADNVALACCVGGVILNADIGRAGTKHRGVGILQVCHVLSRIAHNKRPRSRCASGTGLINQWCYRDELDVYSRKAAAKSQVVVVVG